MPENRRLLGQLTVRENLELGAVLRMCESLGEDFDMVHRLFPRLLERRSQLADTLSGGEQQIVAMGRALMSRPRLLMMDEPSLGLSLALVLQNFQIIKTIHASGVSVLMVKQNATLALSIADRGYVLSTGEIVLEGPAADLLRHEDLKRLPGPVGAATWSARVRLAPRRRSGRRGRIGVQRPLPSASSRATIATPRTGTGPGSSRPGQFGEQRSGLAIRVVRSGTRTGRAARSGAYAAAGSAGSPAATRIRRRLAARSRRNSVEVSCVARAARRALVSGLVPSASARSRRAAWLRAIIWCQGQSRLRVS